MSLTANQLLDKMESLSNDYEKCRQILGTYEPLYDALHDDCLVNIQARKFDEFTNPDNREALEQAVISKLTIDEKEAIIRAENYTLADKVRRTKAVMKRIEKQFDMWTSQLSYHQSAMKQEARVSNYRP